MDVFGVFWIILLCIAFLLGYKAIFAMLVVTSIFQSSSIINSGDLSIPLFYFVEIVLIIRFCFPDMKSGVVVFNNVNFLKASTLIVYFWISSYLAAMFFSGMKVYSTRYSFEYNFYSSGTPLNWSGSNVNQLILLTLNLITSYMIYFRRQYLSATFAINCVTLTAIIFSVYSFLWLTFRPLANVIESFMYNSSHNANAVFENRLSGTFGEPSFAGVFIGALIIPLLSKKGILYKSLSLLMFFLLIKNNSSSGWFTFFISMLSFVIFFREWSFIKKTSGVIILLLISSIILLILGDILSSMVYDKSSSISGLVRQGSNDNAVHILLSTYGIGAGVGSVRISSLILSILANFGFLGTFFMIIYVYGLIKNSAVHPINKFTKNARSVIILMFISTFVGSWAANPDYSYAFLWVLIFCCFLSDGYKNIKSKN